MNLIREVLIDRQLSFNQADLLINQKLVADIFNETPGPPPEDDVAPTEQDATPPAPEVAR